MTNTDETQTFPTEPEHTPFWRRKPTLWIAGGLGAAALLAGGIGLGAATAGDDDGKRPVGAETTQTTEAPIDDEAETPAAPSEAASFGAKDAKSLSAVLSAALDVSKGTPNSMEANRNGSWSVDLERANGDETTVLVAADGSASVVRTEAADADDANDPAPAGKLNDKSLAALTKAAFAKVQGVIVDIDLDANPREAYSVQVLADDGTESEIDLNVDFEVTHVDVDND